MTIEQAIRTIDQLEAEITAENDRRNEFHRMLAVADRVLHRLEELNRDGVKALSSEVQERMRRLLAGLPEECLAKLHDGDCVQDLLDSIFEVQDALFRWRDPSREPDSLEEEVFQDGLEETIERHLVGAGARGMSPNDLAARMSPDDRPAARRLIVRMAATGHARCEVTPGARGMPKHRYFAAEKGEG